jgi:hypothetical protein
MLAGMEMLAGITDRYKRLRGLLDERSRRLLVAAESESVGAGAFLQCPRPLESLGR